MEKIFAGLIIVTAIMLCFGMLYFANGNISFLRPYIPAFIYDNFDLNFILALMFFAGVGAVLTAKGGHE